MIDAAVVLQGDNVTLIRLRLLAVVIPLRRCV
jgi:hypothetical protein